MTSWARFTAYSLLASFALMPEAHAEAVPAAHSTATTSARVQPVAPAARSSADGHSAPVSAGVTPGSPAAGSAPPANPHANGVGGGLPQDSNDPAPDLPVGIIEAEILNSDRTPVSGTEVRLGIMFQRISEGESRSERFARTDPNGHARFAGLSIGSDYSYRVTVRSGPAEYASMPFNLSEHFGQRLRLHVFPVTTDLDRALVGMRGFIYIEPRDDVFVFEVLYRIFNVGAITWVPENVVLKLPEGFKAFSTQRGMTDVGFEAVEGLGARLKGTFSPGQHDLNFRFQIAKGADSTAAFRIGLLPRVAELRVIAEASAQMNLSVDGFERPQVASNQERKRVLVTRRVFERGKEFGDAVSISLSGLPVPGPGRWISVLIAIGLVGVGFAAARGVMSLDPSDTLKDQDLVNARELLLNELVEVERAHRAGELGPRAHADARRMLLDALTRLGETALAPKPAPRESKRRQTATA